MYLIAKNQKRNKIKTKMSDCQGMLNKNNLFKNFFIEIRVTVVKRGDASGALLARLSKGRRKEKRPDRTA